MISLIEIYVVVLVFAGLFSDRLIFQPQPASYREGGDISRIPLPNGDKIGILALTNPAATYTVLYCHGNAEDLGDIQPIMQNYRDHGFSVYALDYRGYGISDGKAGCDSACEDGEAALGHLVARGVPLNRIIIHGRSIGTGIALHLAARHRIAGLILESPLVTAFRVRTVIPIAPFDKLRNNRRIREISCPLLVIHGMNDSVIPPWHGKKLYDLATVPKQCWWVPGADHNDLLLTDEQGYWAHVTGFRDWIGELLLEPLPTVPPTNLPPTAIPQKPPIEPSESIQMAETVVSNPAGQVAFDPLPDSAFEPDRHLLWSKYRNRHQSQCSRHGGYYSAPSLFIHTLS